MIALAAGVVGVLLAVFVERLAIGAAGFLAGGRIGVDLLQGSSLAAHGSWLLFVIGGVVGAVLVAALFDWALILLSSLLGATLIARQIVAGPSFQLLLVVLVAVGVLVQSRLLRRSGRRWRL